MCFWGVYVWMLQTYSPSIYIRPKKTAASAQEATCSRVARAFVPDLCLGLDSGKTLISTNTLIGHIIIAIELNSKLYIPNFLFVFHKNVHFLLTQTHKLWTDDALCHHTAKCTASTVGRKSVCVPLLLRSIVYCYVFFVYELLHLSPHSFILSGRLITTPR